jgi:ribosomal protein S18 acetylase RimI-like enzyme
LTTDKKDEKRRADQTKFLKFLIRRSWSLGARITVVVVPTGKDGDEKIIGSTIWRPPINGNSKSPSMLSSLRMGMFSVLVSWGVGAIAVKISTWLGYSVIDVLPFQRISDLIQSSEHVLSDGYKGRKLAGTPDDSWYLQLAGVDPEFQGKGMADLHPIC